MNCVCGHWHTATCRHCGCTTPEQDDGTDGNKSYPSPDWTLDRYQGGIWGAETPKQRSIRRGVPAQVLVRQQLREAHLRPCGTPAAYTRHLRNGEKACRACLDAEAMASRERGLKRYQRSVERRANR